MSTFERNLSNKDWINLVGAAWTGAMLASDLPEILLNRLSGGIPFWLPWAKAGALLLLLGVCQAWLKLRPLRGFLALLLTFSLSGRLSDWVDRLPAWQSAFGGAEAGFVRLYSGAFLRDLALAGIMIGMMWLLLKRRSAFFLAAGDTKATIEPVRWLGIKPGESWAIFGWIFATCATLAVAIPSLLGLPLDGATLRLALPLLPACLLFAAINAFTEEVYFRLPFLATLPELIGKTQAQFIQIAFFGLAHWLYGSPPGLLGASMTGFLAFLLGKSILETRGIAWAWWMHFLPDVVIFFSYALLWVA